MTGDNANNRRYVTLDSEDTVYKTPKMMTQKMLKMLSTKDADDGRCQWRRQWKRR